MFPVCLDHAALVVRQHSGQTQAVVSFPDATIARTFPFAAASLPLGDKAANTAITDAMFDEAHQPLVTDRIEESSYVGVYYPVLFRASNPNGQCVQRIVLTAPWSEPLRKPEEVFFVDCVEHLHHGPLSDLIFYRSYPHSGRCRPSAFGMYRRREGSAR
jgi:hypothetical protein